MDIGRSAEGCRRPLSAAFLGTLTTNFAHARREWYAQEVNLTLRCAPNQGGIDSVRLDSLLQSDLHDYSIVSVITPSRPATLFRQEPLRRQDPTTGWCSCRHLPAHEQSLGTRVESKGARRLTPTLRRRAAAEAHPNTVGRDLRTPRGRPTVDSTRDPCTHRRPLRRYLPPDASCSEIAGLGHALR